MPYVPFGGGSGGGGATSRPSTDPVFRTGDLGRFGAAVDVAMANNAGGTGIVQWASLFNLNVGMDKLGSIEVLMAGSSAPSATQRNKQVEFAIYTRRSDAGENYGLPATLIWKSGVTTWANGWDSTLNRIRWSFLDGPPLPPGIYWIVVRAQRYDSGDGGSTAFFRGAHLRCPAMCITGSGRFDRPDLNWDGTAISAMTDAYKSNWVRNDVSGGTDGTFANMHFGLAPYV
jgi:hypothetical protein